MFPIVWPRFVTQTPLTAKHPAVVLIPFANDEDAEDVLVIEPPEIARPFEVESPPVEIPPTKVLVAVVVALIDATYGVVVDTTFPNPFTERSVFGLTFES